MITVWGEGRGFRVVWLLEEMGLPYRLRPVDLMRDLAEDPEFLSVNPAGFIPALTDGPVTMVESIAIMEVLLARHGPSPLAPAPETAEFPLYQQFLHLGESGHAAAIYFHNNALRLPDPADRSNPTARHTRWQFENRLGLVRRQLGATPYLAGDAFTAADISVTYALDLARRGSDWDFGEAVNAYHARTTARPAYRRAREVCVSMR